MSIIPIGDIQRRLPLDGRLRMGKKNDRGLPTSSTTWLISSADKEKVDKVADVYGGTVESFNKDQWRVETTHKKLRVVLPPDSLYQAYELWKGSTRSRACDGVTCTGYPADGPPVEVGCLCAKAWAEEGIPRKCSGKSRLSVILPDVSTGTWRLDTSSGNALAELPASVELIRAASTVGFPEAELRIERRSSGGKNFVVPVLGSASTFDEMTGKTTAPALDTPTEAMPELDDPDIAEAEIVEDESWA